MRGNIIKNLNINQNNQLKYLIIKNPLDLQIERKDIFYRESYSEIIDYIKFLLSSEVVSSEIKIKKIKGSILIDAPYGSDILRYIKLIAKTFTLKFVKLNFSEIRKSPDDFILNFPNIFDNLAKIYRDAKKLEQELKEKDKTIERALKFIFVVENQQEFFQRNYKDIHFDIFEHLYYELKNKMENFNFNENGIIFLGINHLENSLCRASFKLFDFYLKIPTIAENERRIILEKISEEISTNHTFDVGRITSLTDGWEVKDIRELISTAYLRNVAKLNDSINDITETIEKIIDKGEFIPSYLISLNSIQNKLGEFQTPINSSIVQSINQNKKFKIELSKVDHKKIPELESKLRAEIEKIKSQRISNFMVQQLYEDAASENYTELLVILDKMKKKEPLEDYDRKLLAEYSFILNDPPNIALILLEKAKKRIDNIKKAFRKE